MKTPSYWYKHSPTLTALVLLPVAQFYRLGGQMRRWWAEPYRARIPVICVGNIVAGGAGKTPVALALGDMLLKNGNSPVFVTRGYGGKMTGPLRVDLSCHTAIDVGDEAILLARVAPVFVGRDRVAAIRAAEKEGTHIIMDDGLQNPLINPDLKLLVIDGETGIGNGLIIPAGPLRETLKDVLQRITAVIMVGKSDNQKLLDKIRCPILRANWKPALPADFRSDGKFYAFAGIGRPGKFYDTCRQSGLNLVDTENFADHYMYTLDDLEALQKEADAYGAQLLTTEKDWVRLPPEWQKKIMAFPVTLVFDEIDVLVRLLKR